MLKWIGLGLVLFVGAGAVAVAKDGFFKGTSSSVCKSYSFEKLSKPVLDEELDEMSGLVIGGLEPDTLVHIRDSGNDALLVYTKRDGTIVEKLRFAETVTDPEEITRGECPWGGSCIYVFDTGDNFHWRKTRNIFAVEEATLRSGKPKVQKLDFSFPHGEALDVEAALLIEEKFYFFAKERKHSRVFEMDAAVFKGGVAEAKQIADLPYTMITGAAVSKDTSRILLISWQGVVEMSRSGTGEKAEGDFYPYRKTIAIKGLEQQEAVSFDEDQKSFLYTSEKKMILSKGNYGIMRAGCGG